MKAAVLTDYNKIEIKEMQKPKIERNECLIKVRYAGICGSDIHIFKGLHPTAKKPPLILCHEFIGTIEELKSERKDLKLKDRVVVEPLISCGGCEACKDGNWHVCKNLKLIGIHEHGGFAEYVKVSDEKVIKVENNVPDEIMVLIEPMAVGFHVNQRAEIKNSDRALVIGGGPIGLIIGIVADMCGASVVFSEINRERINQISDLGFTKIINPNDNDVNKKIDILTDKEGFNIVYEVSGSQEGLLFATEVCRIRGKIVPVGFPDGIPRFNILKLIFNEMSLIGSRVYTFDHFKKAVKMLERIVMSNKYDLRKLISDIYKIDDIEKGFNKTMRGENKGKILINIDS